MIAIKELTNIAIFAKNIRKDFKGADGKAGNFNRLKIHLGDWRVKVMDGLIEFKLRDLAKSCITQLALLNESKPSDTAVAITRNKQSLLVDLQDILHHTQHVIDYVSRDKHECDRLSDSLRGDQSP